MAVEMKLLSSVDHRLGNTIDMTGVVTSISNKVESSAKVVAKGDEDNKSKFNCPESLSAESSQSEAMSLSQEEEACLSLESQSASAPSATIDSFQGQVHSSISNISAEFASDSGSVDIDMLTKNAIDGIVMNRFAVEHARNNRDDFAFKYFHLSSDHEDDNGTFNLGLCYHIGRGALPNINKAAEYYQKAASMGNARAMYNLTMLQDDPSRLIDSNWMLHIQEASNLGLREAQTRLAIHYFECKLYKEAVDLFSKASSQNYIPAMFWLGMCYERGFGVVSNYTKAAKLYEQASIKGNAEAQHNLAVFYEKGWGGLDMDISKAIKLYLKAAEGDVQGSLDSASRLQRLQAVTLIANLRFNSLKRRLAGLASASEYEDKSDDQDYNININPDIMNSESFVATPGSLQRYADRANSETTFTEITEKSGLNTIVAPEDIDDQLEATDIL